ncbi:D-amino-acid transaminase [Azospirillum sp. TSO22-1]|uniref:D-amino-acid transaminase n=1 Tax=Azospirillum sp. TSO22-1 TaxID=716789 RepID=UPI000D60B80F|nr:D-amino-acid transaminase [Azospirillum sp. TSO22-1]PWC55610.1 D-amino acid aminotransferase [Azospirillum sp. TSO22-1]
MARWAYVNGRYLPHDRAAVHIEDRGFQLADGVYEVVTILDGRFADMDGHLDRLDRSLTALGIPWPVSRRVLERVIRELARRNGIHDGAVYMQVSRGVAPRDFRFPSPRPSSLVITTRRVRRWAQPGQLEDGVPVITIPDIRWGRRDIKTTGLLAQVFGKQQAAEAGAFEAWMVDPDGTVTEGCSSNAWIVTAEGMLVTREPSHKILNGVTRLALLRLARAAELPIEERPFTVAEALAAREAFVSSAGTFALPVTRIDGHTVGTGKPGPVALGLRRAYIDDVLRGSL